MLTVEISYPKSYQGNVRASQILSVVAMLKDLSIAELPSKAGYQFTGKIDEDLFKERLQRSITFKSDDDLDKQIKMAETLTPGMCIKCTREFSEPEKLYNLLQKKAKIASSICDFSFVVSCKDRDILKDQSLFDKTPDIFSLDIEGVQYYESVSAETILDALNSIAFGVRMERECPKRSRKSFQCHITDDERNALVRGIPIEGLKNNPDRGAATLVYDDIGIDIEVNINPDECERGNIDYFICRRQDDNEWEEKGYSDDLLGKRGYSDTDFINFRQKGWKERLKTDMARVLDLYISTVR